MTTAAQKSAANDKSSSTPKAKRKMPTPAERIAKAEADLKALREKAHEKDAKLVKSLTDKRDALEKKKREIETQVEDLNGQISDAEARIQGPVTDGVGEAGPVSAS